MADNQDSIQMTQGYMASLDRVFQNHLVIENLANDAEREASLFQTEYERAIYNVRHIVEEHEEKQLAVQARVHDAGRGIMASFPRFRENLTEYHTAMPFIGERGTGKTSAMESVHRYLSENSMRVKSFPAESREKEVYFVCLDMIDIGTMKDNENIMELILAQLFEYLNELSEKWPHRNRFASCPMYDQSPKAADIREVYERLNELSRIFSELNSKERSDKEADLTDLKRISERGKAAVKFAELVKAFTEVVARYNEWAKCYLVLALDDVDMYKGNGKERFSMLEHIYDYLRIPNLIVLLTYNDHLVRMCCESHFEDTFLLSYDKKRKSGEDQEERTATGEEARRLTQQYLNKLFPVENRIYMPNFQYVDSNGDSGLKVMPCNGRGEFIPPFTRAVPVKEFVLRLIARKTGVFFDLCGSAHFLEARNLRELGNLVKMIIQWEEPRGETEQKERIRRRNRQRFLDYIRYQYAEENLWRKELSAFLKLSAMPLAEQLRWLVDDIGRRKADIERRKSEGTVTPYEFDYNYGDMLNALYDATESSALEQRILESVYSDAFVHCVLSSHSMMLANAINGERTKEISEYIGNSLGGSWINWMLPDFVEDAPFGTGYTRGMQLGDISLPANQLFDFRLPACIQELLDDRESSLKKKGIEKFAEALTLLGMFLADYPTAGLHLRLTLRRDETSKEINWYLTSDSRDGIRFNALNPFLNYYGRVDAKTPAQKEKGAFISKELESISSNIRKDIEVLNGGKLDRKILERVTLDTEILESAEKLLEWETLATKAKTAEEEAYNDQLDPPARRKIRLKASAYEEMYAYYTMLREKMNGADWALEDGWEDAADQIREEFSKQSGWATLPVEHTDMMYNILKRGYRSGLGDQANVKDAYDQFVSLYKGILAELKAQDEKYQDSNFAAVYQNGLFYRIFTENGEHCNPYIQPMFNAMMKQAGINAALRDNNSITGFGR